MIMLIGSQDGDTWWTLVGKYLDKTQTEVRVDFSPLGGKKDFEGNITADAIKWEDGNVWSKLSAPTFKIQDDTNAKKPLGFYTDPNHYKGGTFAGTRMISGLEKAPPAEELIVIGSDDGLAFWYVFGKYFKDKGTCVVDFSSKGGPPDLNGTVTPSKFTWQDGNFWPKQKFVA